MWFTSGAKLRFLKLDTGDQGVGRTFFCARNLICILHGALSPSFFLCPQGSPNGSLSNLQKFDDDPSELEGVACSDNASSEDLNDDPSNSVVPLVQWRCHRGTGRLKIACSRFW